MAEATMTLAASPPTVKSAPQQRDRVEEAFDHAEHRSQVQGAHVRAVAVVIIGAWLVVENTTWAVLYYDVILLVFGILGYAPVLLRARGHWSGWHRYVLIALDMLLIAYTILIPNPFSKAFLRPANSYVGATNRTFTS